MPVHHVFERVKVLKDPWNSHGACPAKCRDPVETLQEQSDGERKIFDAAKLDYS